MKIGIVIPCYNVEKTIGKVLERFSTETLDAISEIVAIDNHSSDQTFALLKKIQDSGSVVARKLTILHNNQNYGYGGSQKIAYQYFIENDFSHFMVIHGDNQSNPDILAQNFLKELQKDPNLDFVIGSRFMQSSNIKGYSGLRTWGNHFFNAVTYLLTGLKMSDSGSAIIFMRTDVLKSIPYREFTDAYQFHPQLNILIYGNKRLRIKEIAMDWRDSESASGVNLVKYGFEMLDILFRYRIKGSLSQDKLAAEFKPSFEKYPNVASAKISR